MRMLLIAVVLIYGLNLEYAFFWYIVAGIAAVIDIAFMFHVEGFWREGIQKLDGRLYDNYSCLNSIKNYLYER